MTFDFTRVHPRTLRWWQERELCHRCAHVRIQPRRHDEKGASERGGGMTCAAGPPNRDMSCIHMRDDASPCGPAGRLFKEKS